VRSKIRDRHRDSRADDENAAADRSAFARDDVIDNRIIFSVTFSLLGRPPSALSRGQERRRAKQDGKIATRKKREARVTRSSATGARCNRWFNLCTSRCLNDVSKRGHNGTGDQSINNSCHSSRRTIMQIDGSKKSDEKTRSHGCWDKSETNVVAQKSISRRSTGRVAKAMRSSSYGQKNSLTKPTRTSRLHSLLSLLGKLLFISRAAASAKKRSV